jgi:hypothetical protein
VTRMACWVVGMGTVAAWLGALALAGCGSSALGSGGADSGAASSGGSGGSGGAPASSSGSGGGGSSGSADSGGPDATTGSSSGSSSGGPACAPGGASPAGCSPIPSSDIPSYGSLVSGTLTGTGVSAALCPGGAFARVESAGARYDTAPYFLDLDFTVETGGSGPVTDFAFQQPTGANDGEIDVFLGLPAPAPGSYGSASGQECGSLALTYYLPIPPGVDCDAGAPPNCPPGCGTICDNIVGGGCEPCTPQPPSVSYVANGPSDCIGGSLTPLGSWDVSLTSVAATHTDASEGNITYFTPHGTLTATLVNAGDAGADSVTLSTCF